MHFWHTACSKLSRSLSIFEGVVMTVDQETQANGATRPAQAGDASRRLKFAGHSDFQVELRRRVDGYFQTTGRRRRDCPQMYLKTAILLACFAASYGLLVFVAQTWWQAVPLAILLGLCLAAIG